MLDYPESMETFLNYYKSHVIPLNVSLVCVLDDDSQSEKNVIGFNFLGVSRKDDFSDFNDTVSNFIHLFMIISFIIILHIIEKDEM